MKGFCPQQKDNKRKLTVQKKLSHKLSIVIVKFRGYIKQHIEGETPEVCVSSSYSGDFYLIHFDRGIS